MKKIIYRKEPIKKFHLYMDETECEDINEEFKKLQRENPLWDICIIESPNLDFIEKEIKQEKLNGST